MEEKSKIPSQFKSYRNIYRDAYIFGLPNEMILIFLGVAFVVGFMLLLLKSIYATIIGVVFLGGTYGALYMLIERFGRHFFKKLLSYYTDQNFSVVRRNRLIKNILKK